jgi:phage baseplate assembly protein W
MAIKIKNLEQIAKNYTTKRYIYKDLSLDITQTKIEAPGFKLAIPGTDIKADFDLGAIKNSLQNLFNTKPGQRFLFPDYGLDLNQFLFQPITELNGNIIGSKIYNTINKYEPRVKAKRVDVTLDPDNNQYWINIIVDIPLLSIQTVVETRFDIKRQSFIILPTSRNI